MKGASTVEPIVLEDALDELIDYRGKSPRKTTSGIPLITAKIVKGGGILPPNEFIAEEDYESWMRRGFPEVGDVVMTTEAPLGEVAQIQNSKVALAQRVVVLRGREGLLDNTYLKYFAQSDLFQNQLKSRATGTTVLGIKQKELRKIPVSLPAIQTQKFIGSLLGALDDKVDLNRQTARTLEDLAQRLFKSWFVDFDPVRAKMGGRQPAHMRPETAALFPDKLVDSPLGPVPEGWESGALSDVAEQVRDSVKADEIQADSLYVGLEHFAPKHLILADTGRGEEVSSNKSGFHRGDLLFGKLRPYFHKVAVAHADGICSTDVLVIRPKYEEYRAFCYLAFSQDTVVDYATQRSTGTRMPRANWKTLSEFPVAVPPMTIRMGFNSLALPIIDRLFLLRQESGTLAELRDRLLPKLISGEIQVPEAQEMTEEA